MVTEMYNILCIISPYWNFHFTLVFLQIITVGQLVCTIKSVFMHSNGAALLVNMGSYKISFLMCFIVYYNG